MAITLVHIDVEFCISFKGFIYLGIYWNEHLFWYLRLFPCTYLTIIYYCTNLIVAESFEDVRYCTVKTKIHELGVQHLSLIQNVSFKLPDRMRCVDIWNRKPAHSLHNLASASDLCLPLSVTVCVNLQLYYSCQTCPAKLCFLGGILVYGNEFSENAQSCTSK